MGLWAEPQPSPCLPTHQMMIPVFLGERVPPETLASTLAELDSCLQLLEDKFLKDQDFLTGPHISVADLVAITELMHVSTVGWGDPPGSGVSWEGANVPSHVSLCGSGTLDKSLPPLRLSVLTCKMGLQSPTLQGY